MLVENSLVDRNSPHLIHEREAGLEGGTWTFEAGENQVDMVTGEVFAFSNLKSINIHQSSSEPCCLSELSYHGA